MSEKARGPLAGMKVLDMSTVVLGPYAGQILGDLGADVIRIESPGSDMTRWAGNSPHKGFGPIFMMCNRNKRSLCLDLKKDGAKQALRELIKTADVFLHNVRLAGVERLGFGYEDVKAIKPDIVYVHAVGYGSDGEYAGRPAYDDLVQAAGGSASLNTFIDHDDEPRFVPSLIADKTTGLHAAYATLAALLHKERTGEGQFVEVPMLESFSSFLMIEHMFGHVYQPHLDPVGYHRVINHNRRPFPAKDGHICIMPYSPQQWAKLFQLGGLDVTEEDERFANMPAIARNVKELYGMIREITPQFTVDAWFDKLSEADIPVMRVNRIDTLEEDPHLQSINFFEQRQHPSEGSYVTTRHPVRFSGSPAEMRRDPPALGQHNEEVLKEAGFTDEQIKALMEDGSLAAL
ncbi:MAG: CoA transferase, partial [Alphaproteobacteria bacterium]|nr:CoA transferase [Alphaproteobacteria bacterium]